MTFDFIVEFCHLQKSAIYNNKNGDVGGVKFAISSTDSISGSKGKAISYQILVDKAFGLSGYNSNGYQLLPNSPAGLVLVVLLV